jgi:hypothetical protein
MERVPGVNKVHFSAGIFSYDFRIIKLDQNLPIQSG